MNTDWITSMLEWFKTHSDITTVIVVVLFFWMWLRSKKRSRKVNDLNTGTTPIPTPAPVTSTPATVETPKKKSEKWGKTKTVATGIGTGLGCLIKTSIGIAIFILIGSYAIQGVQSVRDWEPVQSKNSTTRTIRLSTEWSIPVSDYWGVGWRFKVDPPTKNGIYIKFTQGDEITERFVAPNENNADVPPPPGLSELQIMLAGEEVRTHETKVWTK